MRVHKNLHKWLTTTIAKNSDHFCFNKLFVKLLFTKRKRRACISGHNVFIAILSFLVVLCNNVQLTQSLDVTPLPTVHGKNRDGNTGSVSTRIVEVSPIGSGIIKGFLRLNSSVNSVSSSTFSSLLTAVGDEYTSLPLTSPPNTQISSTTSYPDVFVPKIGASREISSSSKGSRRERFSGEGFSSSKEPSSAENRRKIKQYIPDSLLNQRNSRQGRRRIRDRARFLVGSLTRQNCFSKVICGLGARQPSTKTDLLNDYVYLMNELLVDDDDEEAKALNKLKQTHQLSSIESKSATTTKKKKNGGFSLFTRDDSSEEETKLRSQPTGSTAPEDEDDYNPIYAQIADEELVADDPAILKFMELEAKKRKKFEQKMRHDFRGGYPYPYIPPLARYPRNLDPSTNSSTFTNSSASVTPAKPEPRTSRRQTYRKGPRYYAPNTAPDLNQFISKRRLQFQNEKDFKKRLSLAADTGRTLGFRNQRQCRSIFNDCPLDDKQIDSLVQGLRRVMDNGGNIAAIVPPTTTAQPAAIQAATNALQKTAEAAAASAISQGAPGSKVEIILHLNQNGVPYATQTQQNAQGQPQPAQGQVHQGPAYPNSPYHGAHPSQIPPPYVSPYHNYQQQHQQPNYMMTTPSPPATTTVKPVPEEQLLDFLYGVVNFNSTEPSLADEEDAYDWLVAGQETRDPVMHTLKEMMKGKKPAKGPDMLDEYIETPLKVRDKGAGGLRRKKKPMSGKEAALQAIFDKMTEKDKEDFGEDDGEDPLLPSTGNQAALQAIFDKLKDKEGDGSKPLVPPAEGEEGELNALKDYLGSLKETLLGLYQMNNASLAVESDLFATDDKSSEESKESIGISKESEEEDFFEISGGKKKKKGAGGKDKEVDVGELDSDEEDDKDTEVMLKRPDPNKKKKKKGQEAEEEEDGESKEVEEVDVDDEKEKEVDTEKIFDDDEQDNEVPEKKAKPKPTKAPAKRPAAGKRPGQSQAKRPNKPGPRPQGGKKKKPAAVDDEDEVKEVDKEAKRKKKKKEAAVQDQVAEEEEEEDDDEYEEDGSDENGSEEDEEGEGGEEEEYEEDEEDEDEDEEESRKTGGSKARPPPPQPPASQGPQGTPGKVDPTKITLIFAPSGSGPDKVGSAMEDSDIGSEERKKLATLTEVLLPTAAAPRPLSPKRPIHDPDEKPVVPAARPVYKEFEKVAGNFNRDTKVVNMHDFHENSPQHPTFHKKIKKRQRYRNPATKKKKRQPNGQSGYVRPGLGRPVGEHGPPLGLRPPRPDPSFVPPQGAEGEGGGGGGSEDDEQAQDDDAGEGGDGEAVSGEGGGSSEELEYEDDDENVQQDENGPPHHGGPPPDPPPSPPSDEEQNSDEEEDEEEYEDDGPYDDGGGGGGKGKRKRKRKKGGQGLVEFGPGQVGHVRLPGPGPLGVGRLPPKHRGDMHGEGGSGSNENGGDGGSGGHGHPQEGDVKTLIAVPYFREQMETQYAEGHPAPELVATGTIAEGAPGSSILGNFFGMMGMKQVTEGPVAEGGGGGGGEGPHRPHMPQHYYNHRPYAVSWEDGRTAQQQGSGSTSHSESLEEDVNGQLKKNDSLPLIINGKGKGDLEEDDENLPPREFKSTINVDTSQEDDEDEFRRPTSSWGTGGGDDLPESDVQDDKKGKGGGGGGKKKDKDKDKDKDKKKKKKKKKRKRKKGHGVVSQMHWKAGNPSLFVEGPGIEPILTELKKYVTSVTGSLLYLPPKERVKAPILLSDNPPGPEPIPYAHPPPPLQPRPPPHPPVHIHHHHAVPGHHGGGWDDDDSSSEEDCKGKGKGGGKKKKKGNDREERSKKKKKKKNKKKKGNKDDSCESGWSNEDDGKKGKGKKKGGEEKTREDLLLLADLIGGGPLIIDPSQSPQDALAKTTTSRPPRTTTEVWRGWRTTTESRRAGFGKTTVAPRPWRYKVKPKTPRTTENIFNAQVEVETGGLKPDGEEEPPSKLGSIEGNIGIPITLFETTTERSSRTTPRLDVTTLKGLVPKPTRKILQYKTPAGDRKGGTQSEEKGPMAGTVFTKRLTTTAKPVVKITKEKEDDEHESVKLQLKPLPDGLFSNKPAGNIDLSKEVLEEEDDYEESGERRGRRPGSVLEGERRRPYKHKLSGMSGSSSEASSSSGGGAGGLSPMTRTQLNRNRKPLSEVSLPSSVLLPGGVRGYNEDEGEEEEEEETERSGDSDADVIEKMSKMGRGGLGSGSSSYGIASSKEGIRKRNKSRDRTRAPPPHPSAGPPHPSVGPSRHHQHHHGHNHHHHKHKGGGPPHPHSTQPPTTGWSGLKNLSIRNFLSRYGNNLLDKTMAAYNNGR